MASSFGQYQSGIAPVSGISEAGANIGRTYMAGVDALSTNLSEGIKAYSSHKQEREMLQGKIEGLAGHAQKLIEYAKISPENQAFVDAQGGTIAELLAQAKDAPNMSLGKLRGLASKAEMGLNSFNQEFTMFNYAKNQNELRAAIDSQRPENNPITKFQDETLKLALKNFNSGLGYSANENAYLQTLNDAKAKGANIDIPAQLEAYRNAVENSATDLSKTNPLGLNIIDQVKAARKIDTATSPDTEGYSEAEQSVATPTYQSKENAPSQEQVKPYFKVADIESELKTIQDKIKEYNIKEAQGKNQIPATGVETAGATVDWLNSKLGFGTQGLESNEALRTYIQGIKTSAGIKGQISKESIDSLVKDFNSKPAIQGGIMSGLNLVNEMSKGATLGFTGAVQSAFERLRGFEPLTTGEEQAIKDSARKLVSQQQGYTPSDTLNRLKTREAELKTNLQVEKANQDLLQKSQAELNQQTQAQAPQLKLQGNLTNEEGNFQEIGTHKIEVPISQQERNQRAIDFMTQRLGYKDANGNLVTPAAVNTLLSSLGSQIQTSYTENGDRIVKVPDGKGGFTTHFVAAKEPNSADGKLARASFFGQVDTKTGKIIPVAPIKNAPFKLAGQGDFLDSKEVSAYKTLLDHTAQAINALDEQEKIIKEQAFAAKMPWSAVRKQLKSWEAQPIGATQQALSLTGVMSKYKLQKIEDVLPQGTSILETPQQSLQAIKVAKQKFYMVLKNESELHKINVVIPSGYDTEFRLSSGTDSGLQDARRAFQSGQGENR